MSLKLTLKKHFWNAEKRIDVLYSSSKIVFLLLTFMYFIIYYCVSARFFDEVLSIFFLPVYLSFVMSLTLYMCAFSIKFFQKKIPKVFIMILCGVFIACGLIFVLPVL